MRGAAHAGDDDDDSHAGVSSSSSLLSSSSTVSSLRSSPPPAIVTTAAFLIRHTPTIIKCVFFFVLIVYLFLFTSPLVSTTSRGTPISNEWERRSLMKMEFVQQPHDQRRHHHQQRFTSFQTVQSTYTDSHLRTIPKSRWPPVLACRFEPELTDGPSLARCLLETYFEETLEMYPTLLQFRRPITDDACRSRLLIDVDPTASSTSSAPAPMSPGRMFRAYLSLIGVAGLLGADIVGAGPHDSHPYWRWSKEERPEQWSTMTTNRTTIHYDFGSWLSTWQWEMDRHSVDTCTNDATSKLRAIRYTRTIESNMVGTLDDGYSNLKLLFDRISQTTHATAGQSSPQLTPMQAQSSFVSRLDQLRSSSRAYPIVTPMSPPTYPVGGVRLTLDSWDGPIIDPRIGQVLEIRLWLRLTMHQLLYASIQQSYSPNLMPSSRIESELTQEDSNVFRSPEMMSSTIERVMKSNLYARLITHGFERNIQPSKEAVDPILNQRYLTKLLHYDPSHVFNSYNSVFETYFSTMIHFAIVIKQHHRLRKIRVTTMNTRGASSSSSSSSSSNLFRTGDDIPSHMNIGVPIEYLAHVINPETILTFFKRIYQGFSSEVRSKLIVTIFFSCLGLHIDDLQPIRLAFERMNIQVRILLNTPLAVEVQQVVLSDIQAYFCIEDEIDSKRHELFEQGTCGLPTFFRSESLKLMLHSKNLPRLYPFIRNVYRLRLLRGESERSRLRQVEDLPEGYAGGTFQETFPDQPSKQLKMVHLTDIDQELEFYYDKKEQTTTTTRANENGGGDGTVVDVDELHEFHDFLRAVERVVSRKEHRLRLGGRPTFLENYQKDYPEKRILIPE